VVGAKLPLVAVGMAMVSQVDVVTHPQLLSYQMTVTAGMMVALTVGETVMVEVTVRGVIDAGGGGGGGMSAPTLM
jgi:hypothetical protein